MKIGSLFSGIGGLELGLERALNAETVWQVECEDFPRRVLAKHWPGACRAVRDVRDAGAHNLAPVDLIAGGFPCQDISSAGSGAGVRNGKKSGLWREFARIVREIRPGFVVVENSPNLVSRGIDVVLSDLAACGYDAEWERIGARDVGAPHRRWRLFIVAWRRDLANADVGGFAGVRERQISRQAPEIRQNANRCGAAMANADGDGLQRFDRQGFAARNNCGSTCNKEQRQRQNPISAPAVCTVANGIPGWLDGQPDAVAISGAELGAHGRAALRAYGNAVVPAVSYAVGIWLLRIMERQRIVLPATS